MRPISTPNTPSCWSVSTYIIILVKTKEFPNLGSSLRPQTLRVHGIRQARNIIITLLDNSQCQNRQIHRNNTPPHTLSLTLPGPTRPVAAVPVTQQEPDTRRMHDTLFHREALLVVTTGDFEDVAFEFVADAVTGDFVAHAAVHEDAESTVIVDFDQLLRPVGRVGDVQLHLGGVPEVVSRWEC